MPKLSPAWAAGLPGRTFCTVTTAPAFSTSPVQALARFQPEHLGPFCGCDRAGAIGGTVIHHEEAVQAVGPKPPQHRADVGGFVVGGDEGGDPRAAVSAAQAEDLARRAAARRKGCP